MEKITIKEEVTEDLKGYLKKEIQIVEMDWLIGNSKTVLELTWKCLTVNLKYSYNIKNRKKKQKLKIQISNDIHLRKSMEVKEGLKFLVG